MPIVTGANAVDLENGSTLILICGQSLWFGYRMEQSISAQTLSDIMDFRFVMVPSLTGFPVKNPIIKEEFSMQKQEKFRQKC